MFSSDDSLALQSHFTNPVSNGRGIRDDEFSTVYSISVDSVNDTSAATSLMASEKDLKEGNDPPVNPKHTWLFYAAFASLCIINLVCAIDATILVNVCVGLKTYENFFPSLTRRIIGIIGTPDF